MIIIISIIVITVITTINVLDNLLTLFPAQDGNRAIPWKDREGNQRHGNNCTINHSNSLQCINSSKSGPYGSMIQLFVAQNSFCLVFREFSQNNLTNAHFAPSPSSSLPPIRANPIIGGTIPSHTLNRPPDHREQHKRRQQAVLLFSSFHVFSNVQ